MLTAEATRLNSWDTPSCTAFYTYTFVNDEKNGGAQWYMNSSQ